TYAHSETTRYTFYPRTHSPHHYTHYPYTTLFRSRFWCRSLLPACKVRHFDEWHPSARTVACSNDFSDRTSPRARSFGLTFRVSRSEEHTSELQSPYDLVCRLLLEKKNYRRLLLIT